MKNTIMTNKVVFFLKNLMSVTDEKGFTHMHTLYYQV